MEPNDYRKIPRDARYDPFGDEETEDFVNWDQPEDDIIGKPSAPAESPKRPRIIRENAYPEVEESTHDAVTPAEDILAALQEELPLDPNVIPKNPALAPETLPETELPKPESGLKITRLTEEPIEASLVKSRVEPVIEPIKPVEKSIAASIEKLAERPQPQESAVVPVDVTPILEVRNLHIQFGRAKVLRDVNLTINRGETVAIIGESGCGKTVLLKTLIGLLTPTDGQVIFDGRDINTLSERELTRQRIRYGFVFQQAALFDSMTIAENISFPLRQHTDYSEPDMLNIVLQLLAEVGLPSTVMEKKPAELSGGMRKRVGFARALAMEPEIILYDEPTTGLDPIMSDVINELMLRSKQLHEVSGIVVTHDMVSARKVADRIIMLYPLSRLKPNEPQILFDGTPREIERTKDHRVSQFLKGEAGDRLFENFVP